MMLLDGSKLLRYIDRLCGRCSGLFWVLFLLAGTVQAEPVEFDIEAQSLDGALSEFFEQSRLQLFYSPGDIDGRTSPGVQGTLEPLEALSRLLGDSGLEFQPTGANSIVITATKPGDARVPDPEPRVPAGPGVVEEVIVTAARREQPLSELAMSVSVLTGEQLLGAGFSNFAEAADWVASAKTQSSDSRSVNYVMRGLSGTSLGGRSVDLLIDGATSSSVFYESNPAPLDFERIEIIRGSQGTLYGQNSLAGAIKFVSVRPQYGVLDGDVVLSGWSTSSGDDSWRGSAVVNLPIGDQVAVRLAASYEDQGGFIDNYSPDPVTLLPVDFIEKNINQYEVAAFRGAISWLASERFELYLTARVQSREAPFAMTEKLLREPPGGDRLEPFSDYRATNSITEYAKIPESEEALATLEAVYEFDSVTLTSETTYYEIENQSEVTTVFVFPDFEVVQVIGADQKQENVSQEIRLTSRSGERLEWIAGAYWRNEEWQAAATTDNQSSGFVIESRTAIDRSQVSVYGNLSYRITDRVALEAGLRWFDDDVDRDSWAQFAFTGVPPTPTTLAGEASFDTTSPRVAVKYHLDDRAFLFAGVSRGFRGGTVNLVEAAPPELAKADPDTNWVYELGLKGRWLDGRLQGELIAFYNDWDDIQVRVRETIDDQPIFVTVNGESAESWGIEWQLGWAATDALSLSIAGHLMDSELKSSVRGEQGTGTLGIREGNELPYAPRWGVSARADWLHPLGGDREAYAGLHLMARDGSYTSLGNEPVSKTPDYDQGNARVGLRWDSWDVSVFATNLWNERAYTSQQGAFGFDQVGFGQVIMPRRVGLSVRYRF